MSPVRRASVQADLRQLPAMVVLKFHCNFGELMRGSEHIVYLLCHLDQISYGRNLNVVMGRGKHIFQLLYHLERNLVFFFIFNVF